MNLPKDRGLGDAALDTEDGTLVLAKGLVVHRMMRSQC